MSAKNGRELDHPIADRTAFAGMPARLTSAYLLPNPAEVAAVYRRNADLCAARVKLMPAVW